MTASSQPFHLSLTTMLLAIVILPGIFFYTSLASSLALGTCVTTVILTFTSLQPLLVRDFLRKAPGRYTSLTPGTLTLLVWGCIALHGAVAALLEPFNELRAVASLIPLALVLVSGASLGNVLAESSDDLIEKAIGRCFWIFAILITLAVLHIQPPSSAASPKPVFPYTEPSTLALVFTPFLMFCCVRSTGWRRLAYLFFGIAAALLLENLTLLIGCLLITLICVRARSVLPIALGFGLFLALLVTQFDTSYYTARLDFSQDEQTATSSLVYLQGWQLIGESLGLSGGWGLGFQQLGVHGTNVPAADLIFDQVHDYGNVLDGGFTFSKIVSEFGVFGLSLVVVYLAIAWRSFRQLRYTVKRRLHPASKTFAQCVIVGYFLELFVRGAGYFTGTAILLVASFWLLSSMRSAAKRRAAEASPISPAASP